LQNDFSDVDGIALRIDNVHETHAISSLSTEVERIALPGDVALEDLLPERVLDAQGPSIFITAH